MRVTLTVYWGGVIIPATAGNTMNGNRPDQEARTTESQCAEFVKSGRLYRRARLVSSLRSISRRQAHCDANYGACCRVSARHSLTSSSPRINEYWFRAIMPLLRTREIRSSRFLRTCRCTTTFLNGSSVLKGYYAALWWSCSICLFSTARRPSPRGITVLPITSHHFILLQPSTQFLHLCLLYPPLIF